MKKECRLRLPGKIMVDYPKDFKGQKSEENIREKAFFLSSEPRWLTTDEIELAVQYLMKYNKGQFGKSQSLVYTSAVLIDPDDLLLKANHLELNQIEIANGLKNSQYSLAGGQRSIYERVLIIREQGCLANAANYLNPTR